MLEKGQKIEFRGCSWNADWEFDRPYILYRGAYCYGFHGIEALIETTLIDAVAGLEQLPTKFSECDLKEFKWRRWSPRGFARRKSAQHVRLIVGDHP